MTNIKVGDTVAFTAQFCRNVGCLTGPAPQMRGNVVEVKTFSPGRTMALVKWDEEPPTWASTNNLCHPGPNSRFCAC